MSRSQRASEAGGAATRSRRTSRRGGRHLTEQGAPARVNVLRLVLLGAAIGIPAALAAIAVFPAVHYLEQLSWDALPTALGEASPPWYLVVFLPVVGAAIVAIARLTLPGDGGRSPLAGMSHGATPVRYVPGI